MSPWTNKGKNTGYLVAPSKATLVFELSTFDDIPVLDTVSCAQILRVCRFVIAPNPSGPCGAMFPKSFQETMSPVCETWDSLKLFAKQAKPV